MTRINTNVSSLNAQKSLARSNDQLQEALTRLSTGLRINAGKDDPAGLIASEMLRSDIVSTERAITNSERANQMIATADSALGQVSSLLNDIRGLVSEAANEGAISAEQIEANQLQVDSSLAAIDRISQVTQFQGKRLLDGSLDFVTADVDRTQISGMSINQANFGTAGEIAVGVDVVAKAAKAELTFNAASVTEDVDLQVGGSDGFKPFQFAAGTTVEEMADAINLVSDALGVEATLINAIAEADGTGTLTLSSVGANNDIVLTPTGAGAVAGDIKVSYVAGNALDVAYTHNVGATDTMVITLKDGLEASVTGATIGTAGDTTTADFAAVSVGSQYNALTIHVVQGATETVNYDDETNTYEVVANITGGTDTVAELITLMGTKLSDRFTVSNVADGTAAIDDDDTYSIATANGVDAGTITSTAAQVIAAIAADDDAPTYVTAANAGADTGAGRVTLFTKAGYYGSANIGADDDANNYLQFLGPDDASDLTFTFVNGGASQSLDINIVGDLVTINLATDAAGAVTTTAAALATAVNADTELNALGISVSKAGTSDGSGVVGTGVLHLADIDEDGLAMLDAYDEGDELGAIGLTFSSTNYGSKEFVSILATHGSFSTVNAEGDASERENGVDVDARINGIQTVSDGLKMSINTSSLDISFTLDEDVDAGASLSFTITEGGAQFQLGPDVVSNQQARLGIQSVNTSTLGGSSGQLYQLRSGGDASLTTDTTTAARIVEEAIVSVTTLRGRLGAFQKTTLETNINALSDTLEALTDAESSIRDADFAAESASLTRAQILVQSGTSVLAMANQNPQNVLALLR